MKLRMPLSRKETLIVALIFCVLSFFLILTQIHLWPMGNGDNAFLAEVVTNISRVGRPLTHVNAGVVQALHVMFNDLKTSCTAPLHLLPPVNEFSLHVYAILYLVAPLERIIPAPLLLPILMGLCFTGLLLLSYFTLRRLDVSILGTTLFCLFLSLHPAWSYGIFGQSYSDRFFLLFGGLLIFLLNGPSTRLWQLVIVGLLCASINDRLGMLTALLLGSFLFFYWSRFEGKRLPLIALLIVVGGTSYYLVHYVIISFASGFFRPLPQILSFPDYQWKLLKVFLAANSAFLFFALFGGRAFLIALGMMIPNILGNIGGAEKTGWSTHYHTYYLPVLFWAACVGFGNLNRYFSRIRKPVVPYLILAFFLVYAGSLVVVDNYPHFNLNNWRENPWTRSYENLTRIFAKNPQRHLVNPFEAIDRFIPRHSLVSMGEGGMPSLYQDRKLYLFPAGLDDADYLILALGPKVEGRYTFDHVSPNADPKIIDDLDRCIYERAGKLFDLQNPTIFSGFGVYKRKSL